MVGRGLRVAARICTEVHVKRIDLTGRVFERLTVLDRDPQRASTRDSRWRCACVCGVEVVVRSTHLTNGNTRSCGCLQRERCAEAGLRRRGRPQFAKRRVSVVIDGVDRWRCPTCKLRLPAEAFYSRPALANGISSQCRACHTAASIRTRDPDLHRATCREYARRARLRDPQRIRDRVRIRRASSPREAEQKTEARALLNAAVRSGRVIRPTDCSRCRRVGAVHGHHPDYSEPLLVTWLCPLCHGFVHRKKARTSVEPDRSTTIQPGGGS